MARPEVDDVADLLPAGLSIPENAVVLGEAPVDVFFTNPTGFYVGERYCSTFPILAFKNIKVATIPLNV